MHSADESYDGAWIATSAWMPAREIRNLILVPPDGGDPIPLTDFTSEGVSSVMTPNWSRDGTKIAVQLRIDFETRIYMVELKL